MSKEQEFKIYLIRHFFEPKNPLLLVRLCPELLDKYSFDDLAMISTMMTKELTPQNKSYKIAPLVHQCAIVASMRDPDSNTYIEYLTNLLANNKHGSEVIRAELTHRAKLVHAQLKRNL